MPHFVLFGYYRLFGYNSGSPYKRLATDNDILFIVEAEFLIHTAYPVRHQMFLSEIGRASCRERVSDLV